jgi:hypothetical protein
VTHLAGNLPHGFVKSWRGVVGSNIYEQEISTIKFIHHFCRFFQVLLRFKNIPTILWDIQLIYIYKAECLMFRSNEICVRLFKGVVSTADVVHNQTRCKVANRNGGPRKELS